MFRKKCLAWWVWDNSLTTGYKRDEAHCVHLSQSSTANWRSFETNSELSVGSMAVFVGCFLGWVGEVFFLLLFLHHTTQLHAFPRKEVQSCSAATAMTSGVMTTMGCTKGFWDRSLLCICTGFSPWKMKKVIHPSCSSKLLSELEHKKIILFYSPVICPSLEKETPLR